MENLVIYPIPLHPNDVVTRTSALLHLFHKKYLRSCNGILGNILDISLYNNNNHILLVAVCGRGSKIAMPWKHGCKGEATTPQDSLEALLGPELKLAGARVSEGKIKAATSMDVLCKHMSMLICQQK